MLALAQTPMRRGHITFKAAQMVHEGPVTRLSGPVTIETQAVIIQASQADFNQGTHEIQAHGDVTIKLK
ncbi:MAG TPA: hypothetical protein VKB88_18200 [Bryobacteraceae bacterium]|nr:hypothetical protein [Bryobacteraceae bacterium]